MELFKKEYDYESLYDLSQDVEEALDPEYNIKLKDVPKDEYDYLQGSFIVTIKWKEAH